MTENYIIILTIIEVIIFSIFIFLIIRANRIVNTLHAEVDELRTCLPVVIKDIRNDLSGLNAQFAKNTHGMSVSPQKIGLIVGQIFMEIVLFRLKTVGFGKKFLIFSIIMRALNINKVLKPFI